MKNLLILGGTQQIGRRVIERLKDTPNNWQITTFNRGQTAPELFPKINKIYGDRNTDTVKQLFQQDWDVVLDCSCYQALSLPNLLKGLEGRVGKYIFISTISVYDYDLNKGVDAVIKENYPLKKYTQEQLQATGFQYYGEKKVAAEHFLQNANLPNTIILRPHFIYGTYDWQGLDYYWIYRAKHFKKVLLPNSGKDKVTWTYIEDLVETILQLLEKEVPHQIYNLTTHDVITQLQYLDYLQKIIGNVFDYVLADSIFLKAQGVRSVTGVPMWSDGSHFVFSNERIKTDLGIEFRLFQQSIEETVAYYEALGEWEEGRIGLKRSKEEKLMAILDAPKER